MFLSLKNFAVRIVHRYCTKLFLTALYLTLLSLLPVTQTPSVCDRSEQVKSAILEKLPSGTACGDVTEAQLNSTVTRTIDLRRKGIISLKEGDFNNLTSLTSLNLESTGSGLVSEFSPRRAS